MSRVSGVAAAISSLRAGWIMPSRWVPLLVVLLGWPAATASVALAVPPQNDARAAAQPLGPLDADVRGTTVEAALDADEPASGCAPMRASVWFAFNADESRSIIVALDAAGDLDAVVDVFVRERSQLTPAACRRTNRRGELTFELDGEAGTSYLVRVASRANSSDGAFRLRVIEPERPARFPGERLPRAGVGTFVDRLAKPDDAWSVRMQRGVAYRINLVSSGGRCALVEVHAPDAGVVRRLRCNAHTVWVPESTGLHTLHVQAPRAARERIRYRLRAGRAAADDMAPGLRLANDQGVRGGLNGAELDAVDLYRFSISNRSRVRLTLRTGADFDLELRRESGGRLASGGADLERRLSPGRYFVAVRARDGAAGRYVLRRLARVITRADMSADRNTVAPGGTVGLELQVTPDVDGPVTMRVERFDPLVGWLFHSTLRPAARGGRAAVGFAPPAVGRWRITGSFDGTRRAAPSEGGTVVVRVEEPLED
jgi:hypothetical protein